MIVPDKPDPHAAKTLQEALGGQFVEMRTMMQFSFQSANYRGEAKLVTLLEVNFIIICYLVKQRNRPSVLPAFALKWLLILSRIAATFFMVTFWTIYKCRYIC
ncbi:manganese catalase family protein [Bacillus sp. JJ1609]|uniref:manganese catalase family protein n=1 Tax=Bacillus sp. JJ1609 TaxID=3122977 RepID=UPI003F68AE5B